MPKRPTKKSYKKRNLKRASRKFTEAFFKPSPLFKKLSKMPCDGGTYIAENIIYGDPAGYFGE